MATLYESLSRLAQRAEIFARGAEAERRLAEEMLSRKRPLDAREQARAMLAKVPGSPTGLALWAEAAEAAWLFEEARQALAELSAIVPWRADVWLRLGRAALALAADEAEEARRGELLAQARDAFERASAGVDDRDSARSALLSLCDLDLAQGDATRARLWLERVPPAISGRDEAVQLRRAECALAAGLSREAGELAATLADTLGEDVLDADGARSPGRRALLHGRLAWATAPRGPGDEIDPAAAMSAVTHALRAFILDVAGAKELLATIVSHSRDVKLVAEVRAVVAGAGAFDDPTFVAAFALAEGRRDDARTALLRATNAGDALAAQALLRIALEDRDAGPLAVVLERFEALSTPALRALLQGARAFEAGDARAALSWLAAAAGEELLAGWAHSLRVRCYQRELQDPVWPALLAEIGQIARALSEIEPLRRIEGLLAELERPVVAAIVGEFNAGKSTFINAMLGVDAAPTGILPTTATLHRVAWAADRFARVLLRGAPDRVVAHADLKATLSELGAQGAAIERVQIYAPIERLRWMEILDTPGFNAPDPEHARQALRAFEEAHAVVWLLDLTGPLKASEAAVLQQLARQGLPIVVLGNKLDRLADGDLERVLAHVEAGLSDLSLPVAAGPIAFSAKLALAGRLGDEQALAKSRWAEVEAVLAETLVDRADELRDLALRRRASALCAELCEVAARRDASAAQAQEALVGRKQALLSAGSVVAARGEEIAATLGGALSKELLQLGSDLKPVAHPGLSAGDAGVQRYTQSRVVFRLARPAVLALAKILGLDPPDAAEPMVAAALEGAVLAGAVRPRSLALEGSEPADTAWLAAALSGFGRALSVEAQAISEQRSGDDVRSRVAAMREALDASLPQAGSTNWDARAAAR